MIDEKIVISILEKRIDSFVKQHPEQKDCEKVQMVKEFIQLLEQAEKEQGVNIGWIPCSERLPENDKYILLSFENFTMADIGRYENNKEGGAFYHGDDERSYSSYGLFVNAWQPLPEQYQPKGE